jgi:hypothetical protein
MKISKNFFSFFSSLNQYFPHIPYVASKNQRHLGCLRHFEENLKTKTVRVTEVCVWTKFKRF